MSFQRDDKIKSIYDTDESETGVVVDVMKFSACKEDLFYVHLVDVDGKDNYHIYSEQEIFHI